MDPAAKARYDSDRSAPKGSIRRLLLSSQYGAALEGAVEIGLACMHANTHLTTTTVFGQSIQHASTIARMTLFVSSISDEADKKAGTTLATGCGGIYLIRALGQ